MSAEQGDVETIREALVAKSQSVLAREEQLAALDRLAAALERAELDRDEAIESWQYWRAHGDRELRARAVKAERALAAYAKFDDVIAALSDARRDEYQVLQAALDSEDTSDE